MCLAIRLIPLSISISLSLRSPFNSCHAKKRLSARQKCSFDKVSCCETLSLLELLFVFSVDCSAERGNYFAHRGNEKTMEDRMAFLPHFPTVFFAEIALRFEWLLFLLFPQATLSHCLGRTTFCLFLKSLLAQYFIMRQSCSVMLCRKPFHPVSYRNVISF